MKLNFTYVKFPLFLTDPAKGICLSRGKLFVTLLLLNIICTVASAQTKLVTGSVKDEKGESLPAVSIVLKGGSDGVSTDKNGNFSINIPNGKGTLVFRFVGYADQEMVVNGQNRLQVQMKPTSKNLDEVVVVGYGTQKRSSLTAAISTIKGSEIAAQPVASISNALGGHVAGILFTQGSGEPGNDAATIEIRGVGTTGNNDPLVIVDGVPANYNSLDPSTIESYSVLKDAAAVAPYGLGGANGVILITTKKGKSGKPSLSFSTYYGLQNPTVQTKFVNSFQYATMMNAATINTNGAGSPLPYSTADLAAYQNHTDPFGHADNDILKTLENRNTPITNSNLQLSGGSENVRYFTSFGYLSQDGLWGPTNLKRYSLVSNIDADATKTTKVALSINGHVEDRNYPGVNSANIFYQAFRTPPNIPLLYGPNEPGSYIGRSAYGNIYDSGFDSQIANVLLTQLSIEQQLPFVKGLSVKVVASYGYNPFSYNPNNFIQSLQASSQVVSLERTWLTPIPLYTYDPATRQVSLSGTDGPGQPTYNEAYTQTQAFTYQGFINYHNTFGKNDITGLIVLESRNTTASIFGTGRIDYSIQEPEISDGNPAGADLNNFGTSDQTKQVSAVYRAAYAYAGKYLFEADGREDGSYDFAPGHRFGFFPAFSAGWRISEESFIKNNYPWINNLKLHGSWGQSGNLADAPFQYLAAYQPYNPSAIIGGNVTQGIYESSSPNPNITWERATKTDIGIESAFLNSSLTIESDYFFEKRNNMLVPPTSTVPGEYGIGLSQVNGGIMSNHGFEFSASYTHRVSDNLTASISGNFTYAQNKIVQIFEGASTYDYPGLRQTGRPLGEYFGFQSMGYFTPADFDAAGNLKPSIATQPWGTVHPGDIRYKDVNGDGKIDINDEVPIGSPVNPAIVYGISPSIRYKNFDLNLMFQGAADRDFYDENYPFSGGQSATLDQLDYWTPTNQNAKFPRLTTTPTTNNTQYSSFWVENGSYLRLKTATLGYILPTSIVNSLHIHSVRFYLSAENLFTWSGIKAFDPETSSRSGQYYPQIKVVTAGLNATF